MTRHFAADAACGRARIGDLAVQLQQGSDQAPLIAGGSPARAPFLFFDLETTGLSGGAGTQAFLVGFGWFDRQGAFTIEQHLLVDYASEASLLKAVADVFTSAGALVSFNGKSFDAPVLETRFALHRLDSPCAESPHIDILHAARRFWGPDVRQPGATSPPSASTMAPKLAGSSCSLLALEAHVLGVERGDDVAGFEAPRRYFQFLRTRDPRPLAGVLAHNRVDLLSLAGLTARLFWLLAEGPATAVHAREALALGSLYALYGLDARAEEALERAIELSDGGGRTIRVEALRGLARSARRSRRFETAADRWRQVLDAADCPPRTAREATEALAVHHEHRARDLTAARRFALKSLEFESSTAWSDAVQHRLARLERKMVSERPAPVPSLPLLLSCGSPTSGHRTSS